MKGGSSSCRFVSVPLRSAKGPKLASRKAEYDIGPIGGQDIATGIRKYRLVQELRQLSALRQTLQEMMPGYLVSNLQANEAPARQSCNDAGVGAIA